MFCCTALRLVALLIVVHHWWHVDASHGRNNKYVYQVYDEAKEYYDQGHILVYAGQIEDSLPFFRAANRLYNSSTQFLYHLGVTELSQHFYSKAHSRFVALLELLADGHYDVDLEAEATLVEIEEVVVGVGSNVALPHEDVGGIQRLLEKCAEGVQAFPEVTPFQEMLQERQPRMVGLQERPITVILGGVDGAVAADFDSPSLHQRPEFKEPFVVRNCLAELNMEAVVAELFTLDPAVDSGHGQVSAHSAVPNLARLFGSHEVEMYPQNLLAPPRRKYSVPLREALEYVAHPSGAYTAVDASDPGVYVQWALNASVLDRMERLLSPAPAPGRTRLGRGGLRALNARITGSLQEYIRRRYARSHLAHEESETDPTGSGRRQGLYDHLAAAAHWNMVLVGESGAGMFYHSDLTPVGSFQMQLLGRKRWRICSPLNTNTGGSEAVPVCFEGVAGAGDFVYYPPAWGHETSNAAPLNIAISSSIIVDVGSVKDEDESKEFHDFQDFIIRSCDSDSDWDRRELSQLSEMSDKDSSPPGPRVRKAFALSPEFCQYVL